MASFEELPYEIIEALRSKNLLPFVELTETNCNRITIVIYENQKFRPIVGEWGGIAGVHLIPGVDRRPFTNEKGDQALSVQYHSIQCINGFKWADDWRVIVDDDSTDKDGFEYATNWTLLHRGRGVKARKTTLSFVRRRRWRRVMMIDLNLTRKSLPFELRAVVDVKGVGSNITWSSAYVEIFVNGAMLGNGTITPPGWSKEFTLPFPYIDRSKEIVVQFSRTGIMHSALGQKSSIRVLLGEIVHESNPHAVLVRSILHEDKNVVATVSWKVVENNLFRIDSLEPALSDGQLSEMTLTEEKLSQRLKQKIILLSLGLGSNCKGLIKEITNILSEGEPIVSDLDLMEILDDVISVQGKNEFEKVIAMLKVAEKESRIDATSYPKSVAWFSKYQNMHVYDIWKTYRPHPEKMREIIASHEQMVAWHHQQPIFLIQEKNNYNEKWCHRVNAVSTKTKKRQSFFVHLFMRGEIKELNLEVFDLGTYIALLRLLSLVKYYQSGVYIKQTIIDLQYPTINVLMGGVFGGIQAEARADFQEECFDLEYMDQAVDAPSGLVFDQILPIRIPFEYIESISLSHDHYLAFDSMLEIKLLAATSFTSSGSSEYKFRLEMNSDNGQQHIHDFVLQHDPESKQPPSGNLSDSFHIFLPSNRFAQPQAEPVDADNIPLSPAAQTETSDSHQATTTLPVAQPPNLSVSCRLGVIIPQQVGGSPKKTASKRESFFGRTSSSSSMTADAAASKDSSNAAATTGATAVNYPPVYLSSNRDFTSLGHCNISLDLSLNQEKEMQIRLEKKHFILNFLLSQLSVFEDAIVEDRDLYCLIYVADIHGSVFALSEDTSIVDKPSKSSSSSSSGRNGQPTQARLQLKRTERVSRSNEYKWTKGETLSLDSHYFPTIENASYFIVEVYASSAIDGDSSNYLVGESCVPILYEELLDEDGDAIEFRPPSSHAVRIKSPTETMEFAHELVGELSASVTYIVVPDSSSSPASSQASLSMGARSSSRMSARARGNVIKILTSLKPLHPIDCAWPAQFLVAGRGTLDATACQLVIVQEGLIIQVNAPPSSTSSASASSSNESNNSFAWSVLQDCLERKSFSSDHIEILITYDHIQIEDVCALSSHTLYVAFKVRRKLVSSQTQKVAYREIRLELIVGPCLAEEMFAVVCNRIAMFPMRNFLCSHIASADRGQEEAFTRLVKMFQEGIYETISLIENATASARKRVDSSQSQEENSNEDSRSLRDSERFRSSAESHFSESEDAESKEQLVAAWLKIMPAGSDSCALKLLYLKLATLKLYLWYLIEQSPLEFSAERHYLDSSWILFDEMSASGRKPQEDLETLVFRINEIMRTLEQESRRQVLRACRNNILDISSSLTKSVYQKYLQVITLLHEAIDRAVKGTPIRINHNQNVLPRSTSITDASADELRDDDFHSNKSNNNNGGNDTMIIRANPQKKRDLIKFIIINDDIFENFLNSILRSHRYRFNIRPLLSLCMEFEDLIEEFGKILDENILMWNTRTLKHFMSSRDQSMAVTSVLPSSSKTDKHGINADNLETPSELTLPWDITTLAEKTKNKELFISNIPETIQIQLNVEIGLKKVTPNAKFMSQQSDESLLRIEKMNIKIAQAIARSYIALASEYEKVMLSVITMYLPYVMMPGASQEKDDIMCFITSIINDCNRISATHIPQSIELFANDYGFSSTTGSSSNPHHMHMMGGGNILMSPTRRASLNMRNSLFGVEAVDDGTNNRDKTPVISFATCLKAISAVSRTAVNELTNQVVFSYDLKEYFLTGIDNRKQQTVIVRRRTTFGGSKGGDVNGNNGNSKTTGGSLSPKGKAASNSSTKGANANGSSGAVFSGYDAQQNDRHSSSVAEHNTAHSNMEILLATLSAFLLFAGKHLNTTDTERLFYLCVQKIIIRYLLVIRDYHTVQQAQQQRGRFWGSKKPAAAAASSTTTRGSMDDRSMSISSKQRNAPDQEDGGGLARVNSHTPFASTYNEENSDKSREQPPLGTSHNSTIVSRGPELEKIRRDVHTIIQFYSNMKTKLVPQWNNVATTSTGNGMRQRSHGDEDAEDCEDLSSSAHRDNRADGHDGELDHDADDLDAAVDDENDDGTRRHKRRGQQRGPTVLIEENAYDVALSELIKKLSSCLTSTLLEEWPGTHAVDAFLSINFGMEPPSYLADITRYDAALENFFRHDPAFCHFMPMVSIVQDDGDRNDTFLDMDHGIPDEFGRQSHGANSSRGGALAGNRLSVSSVRLSSIGGGVLGSSGDSMMPVYMVQVSNLSVYNVKKFQNLFMKITFNNKEQLTSLRANNETTPQWEDVVVFPAVPLSQCKDVKIELYGYRLRAFKMRRQILLGSISISVVDVLRSEIAHQQQQQLLQQQQAQQQQFGMGGWLVKSSAAATGSFSLFGNTDPSGTASDHTGRRSSGSRLSISSLHRGIQALGGPSGTAGCSHTAWYTLVTKAGLLSSLGTDNSNSSSSSRGNPKNGGRGNTKAAASSKLQQPSQRERQSYVTALSSRGPRSDVDQPQLRLTLTIKPKVSSHSLLDASSSSSQDASTLSRGTISVSPKRG